MRHLRFVLVLLFCSLLVSSCGLLPFLPSGVLDSSEQRADARMEQIAVALNNRDADALSDMFSPYALGRAPDLDAGLEYLLSFFPDGGVTWELHGYNTDSTNRSELLRATYRVTADGNEYRLFFVDFTAEEQPDYVGLYALGVMPWTEDVDSDALVAFGYWAGGLYLNADTEFSYAGIYVPRDGLVYPHQQADARMEQIAAAINSHDASALQGMFSATAIAEATGFEQQLEALLSVFPNGGLTWERLQVNNVNPAAYKSTKLLTTYYKVSADGKDYWLFFADFLVDTIGPFYLGLASLAVTPWSEPGSNANPAFSEWTASWDDDADGSVGIYVLTG